MTDKITSTESKKLPGCSTVTYEYAVLYILKKMGLEPLDLEKEYYEGERLYDLTIDRRISL
jgi:hypothetical protein